MRKQALHKRPRLLYLITQSIIGGAQVHVRDLATALAGEFDVAVGVGAEGILTEQLREREILVYVLPSLVREVDPIRDVKAVGETVHLLKQVQPDLLSCHSSKAGIIGRMAARVAGIPAVFTAHGWAFTEGVSPRRRRLYVRAERFAARYTQRIICVSEYDRQLALRHKVGSPDQLITIHNGMPVLGDGFRAGPAGCEPVRLLMVARFSEQKDHALLLQALAGLPESSDYEMSFAGDGELMPHARELADQLGISDRVRFLGTRTDIPELLAGSHIFALISKWEGFPRSILEAMRAGLPVVTSDVGGSRESVLDGETGFLVARGDVEILRDRLQRLIMDKTLRERMGAAGYRRFHARFTFDQMLAGTKQVYYGVLESGE